MVFIIQYLNPKYESYPLGPIHSTKPTNIQTKLTPAPPFYLFQSTSKNHKNKYNTRQLIPIKNKLKKDETKKKKNKKQNIEANTKSSQLLTNS